MIDLRSVLQAVLQGNDRFIPLEHVRNFCPGRKGRPNLHPETVRQWAKNGRKGKVLETTPYGGTICTTESKLLEFLSHIAESRQRQPVDHRPVRQRHQPQMSAKELVSAAYGI